MIKRTFDYSIPRNVVAYLRMSSVNQSETSPDQQLRSIKTCIADRSLPWTIVKVYRDEAISGKTASGRPGFTKMLNDIELGVVQVSAILVDTIERFGRMADLDLYRSKLVNRHNIHVLTVDRNFSDPTKYESQITDVIDNLRASQDSRIKANDVVRGKMQAIYDRYWPGGAIPFGYRTEVVKIESRRNRQINHHTLVPDPETAPIVRMMFQASADNPSWGQCRLARFLNDHPEIPEKFKPFFESTVADRLKSLIYRGILVWSEHSTGIVDDRRVRQRNDTEDVIRVPGFCEPICDAATLEKVDAGIIARSTGRAGSKKAHRGTNLRYPLTGLLRCGHCGQAMVPSSTTPYTTKTGESKNYCSYVCSNRRSGVCDNNIRVPEEWIRDTTIKMITDRLFPGEDGIGALIEEVRDLVNARRERDYAQQETIIPQLESERQSLEQSVTGWTMTLGQPSIPQLLREKLTADSGEALERIQEIDASISLRQSESMAVDRLIQRSEVKDRLKRLGAVLADSCPTSANLELSMHIQRIDCHADGRVVCRSCKLGSVPEAVRWFGDMAERTVAAPSNDSAGRYTTKPRRRDRLNADDPASTDDQLRARIDMARDPHRFDGLPDDWFWVDEFRVPKQLSWTQKNRQRVLERYRKIQAETGGRPSANALSREFGVSRPTILAALDIAERKPNETPKHRRPTVKIKGNREVEARIEQLHDERVMEKDIADVVGVSRSAITMALGRLYQRRGLPKPDGRSVRHHLGPSENSVYVRNAQRAYELWRDGESLSAIGRTLNICDLTAQRAVEHWCSQNGLPEPTTASRRQQWIEQAAAAVRSGRTLKEVARQFGKSTATIRSWLAESNALKTESSADHKSSGAA